MQVIAHEYPLGGQAGRAGITGLQLGPALVAAAQLLPGRCADVPHVCSSTAPQENELSPSRGKQEM